VRWQKASSRSLSCPQILAAFAVGWLLTATGPGFFNRRDDEAVAAPLPQRETPLDALALRNRAETDPSRAT
jgi:hypothetical protein